MIRGVLFDMDGLLLDTEVLGSQLLPKVAAMHGYDFPHELYLSILGCNTVLSKQKLLAHFGGDYPYEVIMHEFFAQLLQTAQAGQLPLKKGLTECMQGLKARGLLRALATSTERSVVDEYIAHTPPLQGVFDTIVCGTEVAHSKPEPDIYLEAAKRLGVSAAECLGVEDSFNGVRSVAAAGCISVMIPDLLPFDEHFAPYVHYRLNDLGQLCGLADRLNLEARVKA
ncbi:MAG: HAD family phosphatase [Clostridia bacterium]